MLMVRESQLQQQQQASLELESRSLSASPCCLPHCCTYRDPTCFGIISQGQLERNREAAGRLLSLGAFQLGNSSSDEASPNCELPGVGAEQAGSRLHVMLQRGTACSACQAAPPGTAEAGDNEILALHTGKILAVWKVNKMLNLQPLIYCAAC